ncbi:AMP-dependent synthetase and ligase, partial [Coniochaeta sp. PMI_546]
MAGGAFVPLDPGTPASRIQNILADSKATVVLTGTSTVDLFSFDGISVLVVDEALLSSLPDSPAPSRSPVLPHNTSVILFTSGSTGRPKGIVMQHNGLSSTAAAYGSALGVGPGVRVLQFSAFTFDIGVLDVLVTLMRGACLCIPSESSRVNDLAGAIRDSRADWVLLTPTVAGLLSPADVPALKMLALAGEAIPKRLVDTWKDNVDLHAIYGPAEASTCAWNPDIGRSEKSTNIGHPLASAFWVVNPHNHRQLLPRGCVGELLVQGPMLARGYLTDDSDKGGNWIDNVDWIPGKTGERGYLTGDLVRQNEDDTFIFIGRKDSQIK